MGGRDGTGRAAVRRMLALTVALVLAGGLTVGATQGARAAGETTSRVSVSSAGKGGNALSVESAVSAHGRYVAFASHATNLVRGDTNARPDVFVRDRLAGTTRRVSIGAGGQADDSSFGPAMSADGRYVAFESEATNLVSGDTNGVRDVFVRDLLAGTTRRVSLPAGGGQANGHSYIAAISSDGRVVAYVSEATNLVAGDTNETIDIFVRDRAAGTTRRVSVATAGAQADGASIRPAISADGRFVAFESDATTLVAGDTNGATDVFVRDRIAGTTSRVSVGVGGAQAQDGSFAAAVSATGRFVAFVGAASNLVSGDTNAIQDIFVRDRSAGTTSRVSVGAGGQADAASLPPVDISADGRHVSFLSAARNLVVGDTNDQTDVFVRDRTARTTRRASVGVGGQADGFSFDAALSADGAHVAFTSVATNLVNGDGNNTADVFVRDSFGDG